MQQIGIISSRTRDLIHPFSMTYGDWQRFFSENPPSYRAEQVMKWFYHQGVLNIDKMTNISKLEREKLAERFVAYMPTKQEHSVSRDSTEKWLLRLADGMTIESVYIKEANRGTICISSQVGCPLKCAFCATGAQGFSRNLLTEEIVAQLWMIKNQLNDFSCDKLKKRAISNVVFMGMGEPFLNIDAVLKAVDIMLDDLGFGLSRKRVTVSTAGILPGIDRFSKESSAALAVSLHAANDNVRDKLVPINRSYPLKPLMQSCHHYVEQRSGDPITFEYIMLKDVNDSITDAKLLAKLLRTLPCKINLIPHNAFTGNHYQCSALETIDIFRDILQEQDFVVVTRKTRGADIMAACGQLARCQQAGTRSCNAH